jgi:hypothetical protein
MSPRLVIALGVVAVLLVANIAWRVWAEWGLITIDADNAPISQVALRISKQAGVRIVSNAPADATVTIHVHKAPLVHALQVLANNTGASWTVGYLTAANKADIETALATFSSGDELTGWKKFLLPAPPMPGMGAGGVSDPRVERWDASPAADGKLQAYLDQASQAVNAQFWAPVEWNPAIARAPGSGRVGDVVRKLAKAAHGQSAEVILLVSPVQNAAPATMAGGPPGPRGTDGGMAGGGPPGGMPNDAMRAAIEKRMRASIDALPADKRKKALAEFEDRKKFFDALMQLPPEERAQKMQEHMEQVMQSGEMDKRFTQMDAMHTVEQRADFFRRVLQFKANAKQQ